MSSKRRERHRGVGACCAVLLTGRYISVYLSVAVGWGGRSVWVTDSFINMHVLIWVRSAADLTHWRAVIINPRKSAQKTKTEKRWFSKFLLYTVCPDMKGMPWREVCCSFLFCREKPNPLLWVVDYVLYVTLCYKLVSFINSSVSVIFTKMESIKYQ